MKKFSFVILHYNSIEDTIECVNSIFEKIVNQQIHIYIVDNASPNGSGKSLFEMYRLNPNVTIFLNSENVGFAKGNNIGIANALKDGFDDFVIVLNNDTKIVQDDFCELITKNYENHSFAVLGPTIYTPQGDSFMNPFGDHIVCGKELVKIKRYYARSCFLLKANYYKIWKIYSKIRNLIFRVKGKIKRVLKKIPKGHFYKENCVLHGCCLVFSKRFFEKFNGFDPRTFLYLEEEILYVHAMKNGLKTIYAPEVKIWHKEDGSTDSVYKNSKEKMIFIYTNFLKSLDVYQDVLNEYRIN